MRCGTWAGLCGSTRSPWRVVDWGYVAFDRCVTELGYTVDGLGVVGRSGLRERGGALLSCSTHSVAQGVDRSQRHVCATTATNPPSRGLASGDFRSRPVKYGCLR
jgi:hypothetical protein